MATVFQEGTETGIINAIAVADAETSAPTAPDTGSDYTFSSDWAAVSAKLTEDDLSFTDSDGEIIEVRPPGTRQNQGLIIIEPPGILRRVDITHYEVGTKVYENASNVSDTSGVHTWGDTLTKKAVIIQWAGLGALYIPSAYIFARTPSGGRTTLAKQVVEIHIEATDEEDNGYQWIHFQDYTAA